MHQIGWIRCMSKHPLALPRFRPITIQITNMNIREVDFFSKIRSQLSSKLPEQRFLLYTTRTAVSRDRRHIYDSQFFHKSLNRTVVRQTLQALKLNELHTLFLGKLA